MTNLTPVAIDYETYYGPKYDLKSCSYSEYVTSTKFEYMGVAISIDGCQAKWYYPDQIDNAIRAIDWPMCEMRGHNLLFDAFVAKHHSNVVAGSYFCTMNAACAIFQHYPHDLDSLAVLLRLNLPRKKDLGPALENARGKHWEDLTPEHQNRFIEYGLNDVNLTDAAANILKDYLPELELFLIDHTIKNWLNPTLELNYERLESARIADETKKQELYQHLGLTQEMLGKNDFVCDAFRKLGVEPPMKWSQKQKKWIPAFAKSDEEFLDLLESPHDDVRLLAEGRAAAKSTIFQSRCSRLKSTADMHNGKIPVCYRYHSAHTGRPGGSNKINLTNLPRGSEIRKSIEAPNGYVLVVCDSSNIEARGNTWFCSFEEKLEKFRQKRDLYSEFASIVYDRPIDRKRKEIGPDGIEWKPDEEAGNLGKTCELGLGYGMGAPKFQSTCALGPMGGKRMFLSIDECNRIVYDLWRPLNKPIVDMWQMLNELIPQMALDPNFKFEWKGFYWERNRIILPSGRHLLYPNLRANKEGKWVFGATKKEHYIYGGKKLENLTQAFCRDIVQEQKRKIIEEIGPVPIDTYDENVILVRESEAERALQRAIKIMSTPPNWCKDLPLAAEGGWAKEYSK